ncbi:hypothetical protein [Streptomyces sp. NPDC046712]|uniref:hypothetical protein n=1 Tax=Streptomyces sp. NPDC046712 TaxID=3154802 RepID=UPI0033D1E14E
MRRPPPADGVRRSDPKPERRPGAERCEERVRKAGLAARGAALRPVERVARRAQVAAYNAYVEERERER